MDILMPIILENVKQKQKQSQRLMLILKHGMEHTVMEHTEPMPTLMVMELMEFHHTQSVSLVKLYLLKPQQPDI